MISINMSTSWSNELNTKPYSRDVVLITAQIHVVTLSGGTNSRVQICSLYLWFCWNRDRYNLVCLSSRWIANFCLIQRITRFTSRNKKYERMIETLRTITWTATYTLHILKYFKARTFTEITFHLKYWHNKLVITLMKFQGTFKYT